MRCLCSLMPSLDSSIFFPRKSRFPTDFRPSTLRDSQQKPRGAEFGRKTVPVKEAAVHGTLFQSPMSLTWHAFPCKHVPRRCEDLHPWCQRTCMFHTPGRAVQCKGNAIKPGVCCLAYQSPYGCFPLLCQGSARVMVLNCSCLLV